MRLATPLLCPVQAGEQEMRAEGRPRGQEGVEVGLDQSRHRCPSRHHRPGDGPENVSPGPPRKVVTALSPITGPKSLHKHFLK